MFTIQISTVFSRTLDAELTADLCDVVAPSDVVTVTGIVKAMPVSDQTGNSILQWGSDKNEHLNS